MPAQATSWCLSFFAGDSVDAARCLCPLSLVPSSRRRADALPLGLVPQARGQRELAVGLPGAAQQPRPRRPRHRAGDDARNPASNAAASRQVSCLSLGQFRARLQHLGSADCPSAVGEQRRSLSLAGVVAQPQHTVGSWPAAPFNPTPRKRLARFLCRLCGRRCGRIALSTNSGRNITPLGDRRMPHGNQRSASAARSRHPRARWAETAAPRWRHRLQFLRTVCSPKA
mmetsp:Transcript_67760/g.189106  ORF Transcript_67760/g.189106 Transcript_67760/m.189106 type:complete len:228 (-) Transcript_67760:333-1016(-)